jgi:NADH dehydrogenase (ubiquinone) 1 beta subcomplex subunit 4
MSGIQQYDVSPAERRNIEDRARLRQQLRKEWLTHFENPHRMSTGEGGYAFDPALQRWLSMRAQNYHYFKPNPRTLIYPIGFLSVVAGYAWLLKSDRDKKEHLYRTGQISHKDRKNKFS